jgi:hypothetical protein
VYLSNLLGSNDPTNVTTFASIANNLIRIESSELIESVKVFDIAGKLINTYQLNGNVKDFTDSFNYPNGVYIAEIKLINNITVKKKLIH